MTLSVLCVTNAEHPNVAWFMCQMHRVSSILGAELVLALDGERAQQAEWRKLATVTLPVTCDKLQEDVLDWAVAQCGGDWVLRLDDDETVSPALLSWLQADGYLIAGRPLYAFPRVYLFGDAMHFLANDGMWPDLQTRLGKKELLTGFTHVHAGCLYGTGAIVPYAIEHHKFLVRDLQARRAIAERYETCRPGAGTNPEYARFNLPEDCFTEFVVKDYRDGDFSAR